MTKTRGLGKGISALIPEGESAFDAPNHNFIFLPIEQIRTNPHQPRKNFSEETIEELAASIKQRGILQPLLVKREGTEYLLVAGERRLRAAYKAGLATVPVRVVTGDESELSEISLIENLQREDLNPIEEALAYQDLIDRFQYTQETIAEKVGKSRTAITNALRLLRLSNIIKHDLLQNKISMGHARAYLGLESPALQEEAHRIVMKRALSVRQTERLVQQLKINKRGRKKHLSASSIEQAQYAFLLEELQKRYATKIRMIKNGNKGKIIIEFYSNDDFERIFELLRGN
ncbi:MAG: ParB/RepB/Spo0J family partition protein [Desulfobacterota bacterium]|nr:ParB/RepB/Spo0J family partition protein [Thermodesulfobacteriota bacterium]